MRTITTVRNLRLAQNAAVGEAVREIFPKNRQAKSTEGADAVVLELRMSKARKACQMHLFGGGGSSACPLTVQNSEEVIFRQSL